jgi:hypothetical protein
MKITSVVKISPVVLEKIFKRPHPIFYIFVIISPLKRTWPFIFPSLNNNFVPRLNEFGLLVLEKKIFKNVQCNFTLLLLPPLGEGLPPSFEQTWFPHPKNDLCQVWLDLAHWFLRRSRNCKSLQMDRQKDAGQRAIRKAHLSFQLR